MGERSPTGSVGPPDGVGERFFVLSVLMRDLLMALGVRGMLHLVMYVRDILGVLVWVNDILFSILLDLHEVV